MSQLTDMPSLIREARARRGWSAEKLAAEIARYSAEAGHPLKISQQAIAYFEGGNTKSTPRWVHFARKLLSDENQELATSPVPTPAPSEVVELDLVAVASIDMAYGMGSTFAMDHVEESVLHFPRAFIESITLSPANALTWSRGRGDSMTPTIADNDLVLIDRSQRTPREQDAIWALTIGDMAMVKRLRVRGEKVTILSDNDRVPPDEAHPDEINIVGRVIFIGRRT